jgi:DNA-directed RNA polymerase specialized sigma24 family protein
MGAVLPMTENQIVKQLQGIATKLTSAVDLQKDLMQEMFVYLVHIRTIEPGQTLTWYLKGCEFHARNFLKINGHTDELKRPGQDVAGDEFTVAGRHDASHSVSVDQIEIQGQLITNDVLNLILPNLSDKQQQVLFLLMKGCGVREAARELGITHPAVIKHRKKIARIARELLQESEGVGVAVAVHNGTKETGSNGHDTKDSNGNEETH